MRGPGGRAKYLFLGVAILALLAGNVSSIHAATISGTSTSAQVTDPLSPFFDMYKYTINVSWDFTDVAGGGQGLSHMAMLLQAVTCPYAIYDAEGELTDNFQFEPSPDPLVYLSGVDGQSTSDDYPTDTTLDVDWYGHADVTDGATGLTGELIKYEQPTLYADGTPITGALDPGDSGLGTFWFYSNFAPAVNTSWTDSLVGKAGTTSVIYGDINGQMPECVPEPGTILLLAIGGCTLLKRRRV